MPKRTLSPTTPATMPLTDTVSRLIQAGIAENTRKAQARDRAYYNRWAELTFPDAAPFPTVPASILRFVVEHIEGLPATIETQLRNEGLRRKSGPLALTTLRRMLASLATWHTAHGHPDPTKDGQVRLLLRRLARHPSRQRRQKAAITADILTDMLATCAEDRLIDVRDRALLLLGFASGGRRRSELATLDVGDLTRQAAGYLLQLRRSKNDQVAAGQVVALTGQAASAVTTWLVNAGIREGRLFRSIDRSGRLGESLNARSIYRIILGRLEAAGYDPRQFCAHSLRAGFVTEAARQGVSLADTMAQSCHRTAGVALGYYRAGLAMENPAATLLDRTAQMP